MLLLYSEFRTSGTVTSKITVQYVYSSIDIIWCTIRTTSYMTDRLESTSKSDDFACVKAIVRGKVQGVYYRKTTVLKATKLGEIAGWVRNMPDKSVVEIVAVGPRKKLQGLIAWARKGPEAAEEVGFVNDLTRKRRVESVVLTWTKRMLVKPGGTFVRKKTPTV